ncbi:hypothetical protein [Sphingobium mellinum]|uniref:hypothetical protein n=1 Tax=Sphingobium mellinum TaxID=1387166 RepID=UPI0030EC74A0
MSTRISEQMARAGLLCLALAACDRISAPADGTRSDGRAPAVGKLADCSIGVGSRWGRDCSVDQEGDILTFRHPDGGFRRFHILRDGRGVGAADGSEPAAVSIIGKGLVEISIGDDRYRIPATIGSAARP